MGRKFKPGESGNPAGRQIEKHLTDQLRIVANELIDDPSTEGEKKKKIKRLRRLAEATFEHAIAGNSTFAQLIYDRLDGKVKEVVQHEGDAFGALWEAIQGNARVRPDDASEDDQPTTH